MGNFLDGLLGGIRNLKENGVPKPTRDTLDVVGATIDDDGEKLTMTITAPSRFGALADGLRNTIGDEEGQIEFLRGFSTDGDGGGGYFKWRATATATDDGGTRLNKNGRGNSATGYWERIYSGPLDIRWFGADHNGEDDSTDAISFALASAYTNGLRSVWVPRGTYLVSGSLLHKSTATNPVALCGDGYDSLLYAPSIAVDTPVVMASGSTFQNALLHNLRIAGTFSRGVDYTASSGDHVTIESVYVNGAVLDDVGGTVTIAGIAVGGLNDVTIAKNVLWGNGKDEDATGQTFTADATSNVITCTGHGFSDGYLVHVTTSGTLPAPLVAGTTYWVRDSDATTFKLAATRDGAAIDLTTAGTGTQKVHKNLGKGYEILHRSGAYQSRIHVRENTITGHKNYVGIILFDVADSDILDNHLDQGTTCFETNPGVIEFGYGIAIYDTVTPAGGGEARRNKISRNHVSNCGGMGIYCADSYDTDVAGNTVYDTCKFINETSLPHAGIAANRCNLTIQGNTIKRTGIGRHAIAITNTSGCAIGVNTIEDVSAAVELSVCSGCSIKGLNVKSTVHGILVNAGNTASNVTATGNNFVDVQGPLSIQSGGALNDSIFADNTIVNPAVGVYLTGGSHNKVSNNRVAGSSSWGMQIASDNTDIEGNTVTGAAASGGISSSGDYCHVRRNTATGNTGTQISVSGTASIREQNRIHATAPLSGTVALNGTTAVTVSTGEVQSGDVIRITRQTKGTSPGHVYIDAISNGVSFDLKSMDASDDATVLWEIVH